MDRTKFVEAHDTGTAISDPIEINALGEAFRNARGSDDPLYVYVMFSPFSFLSIF